MTSRRCPGRLARPGAPVASGAFRTRWMAAAVLAAPLVVALPGSAASADTVPLTVTTSPGRMTITIAGGHGQLAVDVDGEPLVVAAHHVETVLRLRYPQGAPRVERALLGRCAVDVTVTTDGATALDVVVGGAAHTGVDGKPLDRNHLRVRLC